MHAKQRSSHHAPASSSRARPISPQPHVRSGVGIEDKPTKLPPIKHRIEEKVSNFLWNLYFCSNCPILLQSIIFESYI